MCRFLAGKWWIASFGLGDEGFATPSEGIFRIGILNRWFGAASAIMQVLDQTIFFEDGAEPEGKAP